MSIKRLRDVLGGHVITAVGGGYRLSVESWVILEPMSGPRESTNAVADAPAPPSS